jgi:hypothetical protein
MRTRLWVADPPHRETIRSLVSQFSTMHFLASKPLWVMNLECYALPRKSLTLRNIRGKYRRSCVESRYPPTAYRAASAISQTRSCTQNAFSHSFSLPSAQASKILSPPGRHCDVSVSPQLGISARAASEGTDPFSDVPHQSERWIMTYLRSKI